MGLGSTAREWQVTDPKIMKGHGMTHRRKQLYFRVTVAALLVAMAAIFGVQHGWFAGYLYAIGCAQAVFVGMAQGKADACSLTDEEFRASRERYNGHDA